MYIRNKICIRKITLEISGVAQKTAECFVLGKSSCT